jgi:flagellar M-ring protein FliF
MATGIQTGMNRGSRSGISRNSQLGKGAPGGGGGPLGKITEMYKNAGKGAKIGVTVGLLLLLVVGGFIGIQTQRNADVKLYPAKMSDNDIREVSTALTQLRIEHKIDLVEGVMLHPKDRIPAQAKLAEMNLPRRPVLTHDQVEGGMGKTAAEQKAIRQQLLEGDITLALREMDGVNEAMVKLAIPDKTYFQDDTKQTTARIFLSLTPGAEMSRDKISGMMNLVASSVPELTPENVKIIDSKGRDLSALVPQAGADGMVASGSQLEIQALEEVRLQNKAQGVLDKAFPGRAEASVNLVMDFSKIEEERFTPGGAGDDGVVVESQQTTREKLNKGDKDSGQSSGELMNGGAKPKDGSDYVNEKQATNYSYQQHKTKTVDMGFRVKRISASVLTDNMSDEETAKIAGIVKDAIGIDETRGDSLTVTSMPFQNSNMLAQSGGLPVFNQPTQQATGPALTGQHLAAAVGVGALMLLGLVGMFLFKQHKVQEGQGNIISSSPGSLGSTTSTITDHFTEKSGKTTAPVNSAGATQVNTTDELEKLVKERPTKVAEMLKSTWLSQQ